MRETEARVFRVSGSQLTDPVSLTLPKIDCQPQMSPDGNLVWFHDAVYSTVSPGVLTKLDRKGLTPLHHRIPARWVDNEHVVEVALLSDGAGTKDLGLRSRCLVLWDAKSGARIHSLTAPEANAVSVSPDGTTIAEAGVDMKVRIRDAETLDVRQTLRAHDGPVQDVAWHPKLPVVATCADDFSVRIWDLNTMDLIEEHGIFSSAPGRLSWSPDGSRLSVQCLSGEIGFISPDLSKQR
jgi:WD40 repeat protein